MIGKLKWLVLNSNDRHKIAKLVIKLQIFKSNFSSDQPYSAARRISKGTKNNCVVINIGQQVKMAYILYVPAWILRHFKAIYSKVIKKLNWTKFRPKRFLKNRPTEINTDPRDRLADGHFGTRLAQGGDLAEDVELDGVRRPDAGTDSIKRGRAVASWKHFKLGSAPGVSDFSRYNIPKW
jgi:hypothetical protein